MGILKKCLSVEKAPSEPNNQISSIPVSGHSVPPTEEDPLTSMEDVSSHSVLPVEGDPLTSTEGVFGHSVPPTEENLLTSPEGRSQMNCASSPDMAVSPESSSDHVVGSNNHSLSITDLPLTQEKVESTYADVFQVQGYTCKLRIQPYRSKARI